MAFISASVLLTELFTEALTKAVYFCTFRPKYLLLVLYFITVAVGVFLFALSFELYILVCFYRRPCEFQADPAHSWYSW